MRRPAGRIFEEKLGMADTDTIAIQQTALMNLVAVDTDGILASEIPQEDLLLGDLHHRVATRDQGILEDHGVLGAAPDREGPLSQLEEISIAGLLGKNPDDGDLPSRLHAVLPSLTLDWVHRPPGHSRKSYEPPTSPGAELGTRDTVLTSLSRLGTSGSSSSEGGALSLNGTPI
jgi:hypothetical protein